MHFPSSSSCIPMRFRENDPFYGYVSSYKWSSFVIPWTVPSMDGYRQPGGEGLCDAVKLMEPRGMANCLCSAFQFE